MKYVVEIIESWVRCEFVDADSTNEATEKVANGESETIDEWTYLSSKDPEMLRVVEFDPKKHELPEGHPYLKYLNNEEK